MLINKIMDDNKQSFWKTIPGILSGIALIITASAGLMVAFNKTIDEPVKNQESIPHSTTMPEPEPESLTGLKDYINWPIVMEETFTAPSDNWKDVDFKLSEYLRYYEIRTINGKHRYDVGFKEDYGWVKKRAYTDGKVVNFYAALDFKFIEFLDGNVIKVAIYFGYIENTFYALEVTASKYFRLSYDNGEKTIYVIGWKKIPKMDLNTFNRIAIGVNNQRIDILFNDEILIENFPEKNYLGGYMGLRVIGSKNQDVIVDFDNFELRVKPN